MIVTGKDFDNRYAAGQEAVNRGEWRLAYDCFNDCLQYLKYYESWREDEISQLEKLVDQCNAMF